MLLKLLYSYVPGDFLEKMYSSLFLLMILMVDTGVIGEWLWLDAKSLMLVIE